jgi:hypothetical protein
MLFFTGLRISANTRCLGRYRESCERRQFYFAILNQTSHNALKHIV